jgi:GNAT superfamily N-acetyltransferase
MIGNEVDKAWSLVEKIPSSADYNHLRESVGWGIYEVESIQRYLSNSNYCICAELDGACIGMARIVGDGGLVFYIQDVIVLPEYQHQGIGTRMLHAIMDYIRAHAVHNTIIGLMAARGKESFYQRFGFTARPDSRLGAGMTLFWHVTSN